MKKLICWSTVVVLVIVAILVSIVVFEKQSKPAAIVPDVVFNKPRALPAFQLTADDGQPFTNANLQGKWTLMFFGFTSCPMLCPTTLTELNNIYNKIAADAAIKQKPQVVFVSVDPERDTLSKIKTYVTGFNSNFLGVTGKKDKLGPLTQDLGVLAMQVPDKNKTDYYTIDHSGSVLLIDPAGKFHAIFSQPLDTDKIVRDYAVIVNSY